MEIISKIQFFDRRTVIALQSAPCVRSESDFLYEDVRETTEKVYPAEHPSQTRIPSFHGGDYENYRHEPHKEVSVNDGPHM